MKAYCVPFVFLTGSISDFSHYRDKIPNKSAFERRGLLRLTVYPGGKDMGTGTGDGWDWSQ